MTHSILEIGQTRPFRLPREHPEGIRAWLRQYLPWTTGESTLFRRIGASGLWDTQASQDLWTTWWKLAILMADPSINEIQVQALGADPTKCSVISWGPLGARVHPDLTMDPREILEGLNTIASAGLKIKGSVRGYLEAAKESDTEVILTTDLDDGPMVSRLTAVVPGASNAPALAIRRFPIGRIPREQLRSSSPLSRTPHPYAWPGDPVPALPDPLSEILAEAAKESTHIPWASCPSKALAWIRQSFDGGKNALVFGPTGSGKTTILQTLISESNPNERINSVEVDASELNLPHFNQVRLQATSADKDIKRTPDKILGAILRLTPDVIAFGELRGGEAYAYVQAVSSGHRGLTTIHASSPQKAIRRMISMVQTGAPIGTTGSQTQDGVMDSTNLLVHVDKQYHIHQGQIRVTRRISEIHELMLNDDGAAHYEEIFHSELDPNGAPCLVWSGNLGSLENDLKARHAPLPEWVEIERRNR